MSTILDKTAIRKGYKFHIERYDGAMEVVDKANSRQITDSRFDDKSKASFGSWEGVSSYNEALDLLKGGYQPTVEAMRGVFKATASGEGRRFSFQNNINGFAPVVPLAMMGVPNSMIDMRMKPIKSKVIDVYYDMTCSCGTDSDQIIEAGKKMLGVIIELEKQGYRFNLYSVQTYSDSQDCDMLIVKIKSASQPIDLKRISFPLTHTAFFRVIGFDWYSRVPGGRYRSCYGHALYHEFSGDEIKEACKQMFGNNAVYFMASNIIKTDKEHIKEVIENGNSKN